MWTTENEKNLNEIDFFLARSLNTPNALRYSQIDIYAQLTY